MTHIYRTAPQQERKARAELRRARVRAYVPLEQKTARKRTSRQPIAPGYVFLEGQKPAGCHYVKKFLGQIERKALAPLYARFRQAKPASEKPPSVGDRVTVHLSTGDKLGTICKFRGRVVIVQLDGANHTISVSVLRLSAAPPDATASPG